MTKLSRRKFFKQASVGAAAIGTLAVLPGTALAGNSAEAFNSTQSPEQLGTLANFDEHLVLHVDPKTRRMVLVYGDQEQVLDSPEIMNRLVATVRQRYLV